MNFSQVSIARESLVLLALLFAFAGWEIFLKSVDRKLPAPS
jgi:hypothetical protein